MIPRASTVIWTLLIVMAAFGLYLLKYRVQSIKQEVAAISDQLEEERAGLHVVAAEWAYLNRPERIQQLSEKYLRLQPVAPSQIADVESLPYPGQSVAAAFPLHKTKGKAP